MTKKTTEEALFRAVYEQAPLGIALVDAETGRWLQVNRRYAEIVGRTPEEMAGLQFADISHPDERQTDLEYLARFQSGALDTFSRDKRYLRPDGTVVWVHLTVTKLRGENGATRSYLALAQDVTARKVAEEDLHATRRQLEATLNALPDLLFELDGEGRIRDFRAPDAQKLYVAPEHFLGRRMDDVLPPDVAAVIAAAVAEAAATGTHRGATYALALPGGERWFELSITRRTNPLSGELWFTLLAHDITTRRQAELALRESEEQFRVLFNSGSDVVFVHLLDPDGRPGRFVEVNAVASRMLGYSRDELLQLRPEDLSVDLRPDAVQTRSVALRDKGVTVFEEILLAKDGRQIPIEFGTQLLQFRGQPHLLSIGRDISERKRLEEERLILGKLESTGVLAGGIAHDFNNLLAALLSYLGLAKTEAVPGGRLAEYLDEAEKVAWTARDLTREFITFSKGGAPVRKLTNLRPIVEEAVTLSLRGSAVAGDVVVTPDLWPAEVDGPQVAQVVRNLVLNARDAMPGGGRILVRADNAPAEQVRHAGLPAGDYVRISVTDRGAGIPAEVLPRIFDPYFTTKPRGSERGLGLGLTICRSIAQRHGGTIAVATEPGRGSTFEAYLPARPAAVAERSPARRPLARVLVMDDDETLRTVTAKVLASYGYDVEVAEDGARAVERWSQAAAARQPFDVAVLDLVVSGGMGGVETMAALRAVDPTARAILVSGDGDDPAMRDAGRHGFAAALPRPYAADALRDMLRAVLQR